MSFGLICVCPTNESKARQTERIGFLHIVLCVEFELEIYILNRFFNGVEWFIFDLTDFYGSTQNCPSHRFFPFIQISHFLCAPYGSARESGVYDIKHRAI
jgi:hypothetical protein